nr:MAG TPA: hypothetical protein [Caudoviricetes sp.]
MNTVAEAAAARAAYWVMAGPGKPSGGGYSVGYSQPDREQIRDFMYVDTPYLTCNVNADCSSLVAAACCLGLAAAYPVLRNPRHPVLLPASSWTGSLRGDLEARGWREVPWPDDASTPAGGFRRGDVILSAANEGGVGHVVLVVDDDPTNPTLAEAWIAEDGSIDGYAGDQTGGETRMESYAMHPYTARAAWTSTHRFDPTLFSSQHPDVANSPSDVPASNIAPTPAPAPAVPSKAGPLLGVDVSNYQATMDMAAVNPDFVITLVTQDTGRYAFTNRHHQAQLDTAVAQGRPVGVYHYVGGGDGGTAADAAAEADRFLAAVRATGHFNRVMWCIDWEADDNSAWGNLAYLSIIIDRVQAATGRPAMLYASSASYPHGVAEAYGCGKWIAQYADNEPTGWDHAPWSDGTWTATMHQYTGHGRVPGYGDDLDLDIFYGSADDFRAYAIDSTAPITAPRPASAATAPARAADGQDLLAVDGEWGPRTVARFQQVMGTPIDGVLDDDGSVCIEAFQRFLNGAVGAGHLTNLIGAPALAVDGIDGPATWKAFQFLVWAWHKEYVPGGWSWGDWIDGVDGPATVKALQRALNASRAGSGRLWT